ncbi:MAG: hypothetical protein WAZ18_04430 [Alphaproteobacteria bacterium]
MDPIHILDTKANGAHAGQTLYAHFLEVQIQAGPFTNAFSNQSFLISPPHKRGSAFMAGLNDEIERIRKQSPELVVSFSPLQNGKIDVSIWAPAHDFSFGG